MLARTVLVTGLSPELTGRSRGEDADASEDHRFQAAAPTAQCGIRMSTPPADQTPGPAGNPEFEELFRQLFRPLTMIGLAAGLTAEEAKDAAETALLEVSQRWLTLTNPAAWAYRATLSAIKKTWRKQAAEERALERKFSGSTPPEIYEDPELAAVDYRQWAMSLLRALPPAQRAAAAYCLIDGLTPAEAAELAGIPGATMRQRLRAAITSLRQLLAEDAAEPGGLERCGGTSTIPAFKTGRRGVQ